MAPMTKPMRRYLLCAIAGCLLAMLLLAWAKPDCTCSLGHPDQDWRDTPYSDTHTPREDCPVHGAKP